MIEINFKIIKLKIKDQYYSKIDMFTKGNGNKIKEVVEVCKYGKMVQFIKDIGNII